MSSHFQFLGLTNYIGIDSKIQVQVLAIATCWSYFLFLLHSLPPRHLFLASKILWEAISNSNSNF